jgi:hypothetical protein
MQANYKNSLRVMNFGKKSGCVFFSATYAALLQKG